MARLIGVLLLTALVALSLPYAALAQGAGDEQYTDPFGEVPEDSPAGDESPGDGSDAQPQPGASDPSGSGSESAPAAEAAPGVVTQPEPAATTSPAPELARTGLDAGAVALFGLWLLVTGATLRLALSPLPRPPDHPRR